MPVGLISCILPLVLLCSSLGLILFKAVSPHLVSLSLAGKILVDRKHVSSLLCSVSILQSFRSYVCLSVRLPTCVRLLLPRVGVKCYENTVSLICCLSLFVSHPLSVSVSLSLYLSLYLCLSVSISLCLSLSVALSPFLCSFSLSLLVHTFSAYHRMHIKSV